MRKNLLILLTSTFIPYSIILFIQAVGFNTLEFRRLLINVLFSLIALGNVVNAIFRFSDVKKGESSTLNMTFGIISLLILLFVAFLTNFLKNGIG